MELARELKEELEQGKEFLPGASQHKRDIEGWEWFLKESQILSLLELGTGSGVFSKWLSRRVDWFVTIDNKEPIEKEINFIETDIFSKSNIVKNLISNAARPFCLYCDNGDKRREIKEFSKYLRVGDYLAAHDFPSEINLLDFPQYLKVLKVNGLTVFSQRTR